MYWLVAPAARMPLMAAWLRFRTRVWSMSWNSLSMDGFSCQVIHALEGRERVRTCVEDD
jgi:hypothetical protein